MSTATKTISKKTTKNILNKLAESSENTSVTSLEEKNRRGHPFKNFDRNQFEALCKMQCTEKEICGFFDTTDKTINNWCRREYGMSFLKVYAQKSMAGKASLRRMQWKKAQEGDTTMLIFLGKTMLGQNERQEIVITNKIDMGNNIANDFLEYDGANSIDTDDAVDAEYDEYDSDSEPMSEVEEQGE